MIAHRFAGSDLAIGLRVGHAGVDVLENLFFGEPGILQARNFGTAERGERFETALQNKLDEIVGQPDQVQGNGIAADGVELVGLRDFQNLRFGVTGARQICGGIATDKGDRKSDV
jgi:hypothetical protein